MNTARTGGLVCAALALLLGIPTLAHAAPCTGGDINGDAVVTVADVQITILGALGATLPLDLDSDLDGIVDACDGVGNCGAGTVLIDGLCVPNLGEGVFIDGGVVVAAPTACEVPDTVAEYTVVFESTWSPSTHPVSFPPFPHYSGLVGATHDDSLALWNPGGIATPGIESMAETGSKFALLNEVNSAVAQGSAYNALSGPGLGNSPAATSYTFDVASTHPLVSLVSMIAPSPDWFVGVSNLALYEDGEWQEEITIELWPWDAGTDSGPNYVSSNADVTPHDPISLITDGPPSPGVPFGTFTFTLESVSSL